MPGKKGDDGILMPVLYSLLVSLGVSTIIMTGGIVHMYRHPEAYKTDAPQKVVAVAQTAPSKSESSNSGKESPEKESASVGPIEEAIAAAMPQDYKESKWFLVNCEEEEDGSVFADIQIDQEYKDKESALRSSAKCFEIAKKEVEDAGKSLGKVNTTVVSNGKPIGLFSTSDGENFSHIMGGKVTEMSLSDLGKSAPQKEETPAKETKPAPEDGETTQSKQTQEKPEKAEPSSSSKKDSGGQSQTPATDSPSKKPKNNAQKSGTWGDDSTTDEITGPLSKQSYWTKGGKSYHFSKECPSLAKSKNIYEGTLQDALNAGKKDPCNNCANGS